MFQLEDSQFGELEWKKLKREMDQIKNQCLMETAVYGWGTNKHG